MAKALKNVQSPRVTAPVRGRVFPFGALVGQPEMKLALKLNAVDPGVGGVLVRGEKGTAKSTAVRGLAAILPELEVAGGCVFGCDPEDLRQMCDQCLGRLARGQGLDAGTKRVPVVDLPLNAHRGYGVGRAGFRQGRQKRTPPVHARPAGQGQPGLFIR